MQTVSFQAPTDYGAEAEEIARRRKYAELLQAQSMEPMGQTQMAGGWAVPNSPLTGLAKMLQAYSGRKGQEQATAEQKALAAKYQTEGQDAITRASAALRDQPARAPILDPQETEQMADQGTPAPAPIPAQPADPYRALSLAMRHPDAKAMIAPLAMQKIGGDIDMEMLAKALGGPTVGVAGGAPAGGPAANGGAAPVALPGAIGNQAAANSYPSWMPSPVLLGAGKHGPEMFKALSAANKPSDLQQDLAAAGVRMDSPEGRARVLDPSGRGNAQDQTLVEYTVPGTDVKVKLPNKIANVLATQQAPDAETAAIATRVAQGLGMKVNIGVGNALGGLTGSNASGPD